MIVLKQKLKRNGEVIFEFTETIKNWKGDNTYGLDYLWTRLKEVRDPHKQKIAYQFTLQTYLDEKLESTREINLTFNMGDHFSHFPGYVS